VGLAIASYEWMAAITLVIVAFFFLPKFLRSGIYTIELLGGLLGENTLYLDVPVTRARAVINKELTLDLIR